MIENFRDADQCARACRALLATGAIEGLWTDKGPTDDAGRLLANQGKRMPPGKRALLLAAWAFWDEERSSLRLNELVGLEEAEPIAKLLTAVLYGPQAIDIWISRADQREYFAADDHDVHAYASRLFDEARASLAEGGDEPMNMNSAPDACALGALRMADYLLIDGLDPIENDEDRPEAAQALAIEMLTFCATTAHMKAEGRDDDDQEDDVVDETDEEPGPEDANGGGSEEPKGGPEHAE